jgi:tRNA(Ile2) C34 agmatinyltransferase TiaS
MKADRKLIRNSAMCLVCGDEIESHHRHDFRSCRCGNLSVDGGKAYTRRVFKARATWVDTSLYEDVGDVE